MIAARVAGRADPGVLHRLAQLLVVDESAGRLHRAQQRALGVAPRRSRLLLLRAHVARVDRLASLESRQLLLATLVLVALSRLGVGLLAVDAAPARHEHHLAARAEDVTGDLGLDARVLEHGLGVEDGEEAARDDVVDAAVVVAHLVDRVRRVRRDDRVVVGDLLVVDDAAERQHVEPGHVCRAGRVLAAAADDRGDRLDLGDHVARQVARAGARIRERLVLLVEALRGAERAPRGEAEAAVRVALQRGEVVEQRRALSARRLLELGDDAGGVAHGRDDRRGLLGAARRAAPCRSPRRSRRARGSGPRTRARPRLGLERGVDDPVRLGSEGADLLLAAGEDRERRRLHAAERDARRRTTSAGGSSPRASRSCRRSSRPRCASGRRPRASAAPRPGAGARTRPRSRPSSSRTATAAAPAVSSRPSRTGRRRSARPRGRRRRR